jgi:hypothetical protein
VNNDPYDLSKLRLDLAAIRVPRVPEKIRKRREHFILVPMWWYEKLANPIPASRCTVLVALHVLHLHWRNYGKPFRLPNGTLKFDGIGRHSKWRGLAELERRGLIMVDRGKRKSPVIHVQIGAPVHQ